jgi:UDP-N-acetylmuramoyl-tripeptide--D-alanyl-D-alanine ligase
MARPQVAVVTSIGAAHLEGFGDLEGVRRAKAGIVSQGATVLVLPHSEAGHAVWKHVGKTWTFGPEADATLQVIRPDAFGPVSFKGSGAASGIEMTVEFALAGLHNGCNLAAALLAVLASTRVAPSQADVASRISRTELPDGRLRSLTVSNRTVIDDAYNANPASMIASLQLLSGIAGFRIAVLGEMNELGSDAESLHREVGVVAAKNADTVIVIGEPARAIAEGANGHFFDDLDAAATWLTANVDAGATLLLKASRGANLERIIPMLESGWEGRS